MPAAYDKYDYSKYWTGRDYEHESEVFAIKSLLAKVPKIRSIIDIGGGFGRLTPTYAYRAKKVILSDPSAKNLSQARHNLVKFKNIIYLQASIENLADKVHTGTIDLAIIVRVLHHITDLERAIGNIKNILSDNGYLIIEFANKTHFKAALKNFIRGNFTFNLDIEKEDKRSLKHVRQNTLPFYNYHPEIVKQLLIKNRSTKLKTIFSNKSLVTIEKLLQKPLSKLYFGPSIFFLAKKQ